MDKLVLLCPGQEFTAGLPLGKIPDRSDFSRLKHTERVRYWEECIERSRALAEEMEEVLTSSDPLRWATVLP